MILENFLTLEEQTYFLSSPLRIPGYSSIDASSIKAKVGTTIATNRLGGFCACRLGNTKLYLLEPYKEATDLIQGEQALIDLIQNKLYITDVGIEPAIKEEWQFFIQFIL